jgi:hypothetical protein
MPDAVLVLVGLVILVQVLEDKDARPAVVVGIEELEHVVVRVPKAVHWRASREDNVWLVLLHHGYIPAPTRGRKGRRERAQARG